MPTDLDDLDLDPDDDLDDDETGNAQQGQQDSALVRRLRKQLEKSQKGEREARRDAALAHAGIPGINERQQRALLASIDGEVTPEKLREAAADLGFIAADDGEDDQGQAQADESADAHGRISGAAKGSDSAAGGDLTPAEAATWPMDRMRAFAKEHPDAWELLKRGEPVPRPTA